MECSRLEFYRLISQQRFTVIDYTEAEFAVVKRVINLHRN
ncbi:hypothetical protein PL9631_960022 [Planktothrix paucivesiculata PCC 9631]|uniref:Uncharacterized protein n=1 Tax=Planktothrix paucivesiculata PCC 9631 TaxID=671071 RepID=A0A7Z9E4U1_9CYAN|nr:hypothetical protein PL9631_960022 [Planktothrix paucivesiculata PCC 9631]